MTYAEKIATDIIQSALLEDIPIREAIARGIEYAMRQQREEYSSEYTFCPAEQIALQKLAALAAQYNQQHYQYDNSIRPRWVILNNGDVLREESDEMTLGAIAFFRRDDAGAAYNQLTQEEKEALK